VSKSKLFLSGKALAVDRRAFLKRTAAAFTALGSYLLNPRFSLAKALVITPETLPESAAQSAVQTTEVLRYHTVIVDENNKILPWYTPMLAGLKNRGKSVQKYGAE
jgi:hypothetical protein